MKHIRNILLGVIVGFLGTTVSYYMYGPRQGDVDDVDIEEPAGDKNDLIQVVTPKPNALITSPLTIEGTARGNWYFEASFPITLLDAQENELGTTVAQAQGEWMTENFVPFTATLTFSPPQTQTGTLVLQKDNPSGLPENDDELRIPVRFAQSE